MSISLRLYREFIKKCKDLASHEQNVTKLKQQICELLDNEKYYNVFMCPNIPKYEHCMANITSCNFTNNLGITMLKKVKYENL